MLGLEVKEEVLGLEVPTSRGFGALIEVPLAGAIDRLAGWKRGTPIRIVARPDQTFEVLAPVLSRALANGLEVYFALEGEVESPKLSAVLEPGDAASDQPVRLSHIFFARSEDASAEKKKEVLLRAQAARARVLRGERFDAIARELSESASRDTGGLIGELRPSEMLPELRRALASLAPGAISEPVESSNGVHLLRFERRESP